MSAYHPDTICAVATSPGRGGVGIVRISGCKSREIGEKIVKLRLKPRNAHYASFRLDNQILDQGIALFFPGPHSFTGEDVVELQGHGGPVVLDMLVAEIIRLGGRLAQPGEFSERAFLNDKLDLAQAEAIADLIDASSQQAARQAMNSLKGEFSTKISAIVDKLISLRAHVESAIDFPEEEIDFLSDGNVAAMLDAIVQLTDITLHQARQGALLREGMNVVIAGRPNAGKSSLLNRLAATELAIVTDIAGTTRDVLRQHIHIDGLPLHIIDTAGLRDSNDRVEQLGIERAWTAIEEADRILLMIDSTDQDQLRVEDHWRQFFTHPGYADKLTLIYNKIDRSALKLDKNNAKYPQIALSALTGEGMDSLRHHLKHVMGYEGANEGGFSARRRHIVALEKARQLLLQGQQQLATSAAGELLAEDLKAAQMQLSQITGSFTSDELLGEIFASFCIGK